MASTDTNQGPTDSTESKPVAPVQKKINHSWYQSETCVFVVIPIRGVQRDQVTLNSTEQTLDVEINVPSNNVDYKLNLDLAFPINNSKTDFKTNIANVEVRLYKVDAIQWTSLDLQHKPNAPPVMMNRSGAVAAAAVPPSYPSSSKKAKDWDKIEVEIKNEEKDEPVEGDAALNKLFQQIYKDGTDDQKKAMVKSFTESGGTVLSTNWDEISKQKTECKPPDGMEWKSYND